MTSAPHDVRDSSLAEAERGVRIDDLTPPQQEYLASWTHGA